MESSGLLELVFAAVKLDSLNTSTVIDVCSAECISKAVHYWRSKLSSACRSGNPCGCAAYALQLRAVRVRGRVARVLTFVSENRARSCGCGAAYDPGGAAAALP
jgi:hypothetical protein